jgi:hypothetical protein
LQLLALHEEWKDGIGEGGGGLSAIPTFCDRRNLNSLKCQANFVFGFNLLTEMMVKIIDIGMGHSEVRKSVICEFFVLLMRPGFIALCLVLIFQRI